MEFWPSGVSDLGRRPAEVVERPVLGELRPLFPLSSRQRFAVPILFVQNGQLLTWRKLVHDT